MAKIVNEFIQNFADILLASTQRKNKNFEVIFPILEPLL